MAFVEMTGIVKRYPGVLANDGIDLSVERGEIHAVMGENGAGKSTLMAILYGLQVPDAGEIRLDGEVMRFRSPIDAIAAGIGMVHQAFKLFESLTVWENVVYGREPRGSAWGRGLLIDRATARHQVRELGETYGLPIDPDARVSDLSVGVRQRLEILKALYRQARVLILDEPTAVLTPAERDGLFAVMRALAEKGCAILFVTHKLREVMAVSRRITVLRDGRVTDRLETARTTPEAIVRAMTGRNVLLEPKKAPQTPGAVLLETDSLVVREGEIVGIAGVAGNGQSELVETIMGLRPGTGAVRLCGRRIDHLSTALRRKAGLAYVAEDRALTATAPVASAADNLAMGFHRKPPLSRRGILQPRAIRAWARALIAKFGIKIGDETVAVGTLSGGNLQKVVIARELAYEAPLLIAEQPTRGVDVGAIEFIHGQLLEQRRLGRGILLVSAEMSEILALSDRILVMYEGKIITALDRAQADEGVLGMWMAGGPHVLPAA